LIKDHGVSFSVETRTSGPRFCFCV
jgi:hypothetical protein